MLNSTLKSQPGASGSSQLHHQQPQQQSQSPSMENYMAVESLLQSHNDLILAIHKSFNDTTAHINRSIVGY